MEDKVRYLDGKCEELVDDRMAVLDCSYKDRVESSCHRELEDRLWYDRKYKSILQTMPLKVVIR